MAAFLKLETRPRRSGECTLPALHAGRQLYAAFGMNVVVGLGAVIVRTRAGQAALVQESAPIRN